MGPGVNDRSFVEVLHGGQKAVLEFLPGRDEGMAQHRTGELGEESFDQVQPGAIRDVSAIRLAAFRWAKARLFSW